MKHSNNYWAQRERQWIKQQIKDDQQYVIELQRHYKLAIKNIEDDIVRFYTNYAAKEKITLLEARKRISQFEVKAFEKTAKEMVKNKDFSDYANDRLRIYNATMRINRLEYLKSQVGTELVKLNADEEANLQQHLSDKYIEQVKRQAGILSKHQLNNIVGAVDTVVNASFHGAQWSQRIWANTDVLKSKLDTLLTRSLVQGINPKVLARELRSQVNKEITSSRYMAERLMRTETARVQDIAQIESLKQAGIEYVKWIAEPDACEECLDIANAHDGIYSINKVQGIPVHVNCRCSKAAYVPKPGELESETEKIQRYIDEIDLETAENKDVIHLGKLVDEKYDIGKYLGDKTKLKSIFAKYRPMGGKVPREVWYTKSDRTVKAQLKKAFSYYPKDWANYLKANNQQLLAGRLKDRGFFSPILSDSTGNHHLPGADPKKGVSIYATGDRATTPYHEIGHLVDHFNSNLIRIEKDFIRRRTLNEKEIKLQDIFPKLKYDENEVTKKDNFISPYIGKNYINATEVLSTGLESIFEPEIGALKGIDKNGHYVFSKITDDLEYLHLIIGLILKG